MTLNENQMNIYLTIGSIFFGVGIIGIGMLHFFYPGIRPIRLAGSCKFCWHANVFMFLRYSFSYFSNSFERKMTNTFHRFSTLRNAFFTTLFLFSGTIWSCSSHDPIKRYSLVISNVTIIPIHKDSLIKNVDLFVNKGRIEKIEQHKKGRELDLLSDLVINGSDRYLLPGFVDCHVHYGDNEDLFSQYDSLYLKYGITKVVALNGTDNLLKHRESIRKKAANAPDIYCSSPRNNDPSMTADQANDLLKEFKKKGYDFIKIYNNISKNGFYVFSGNAKKYDLRLLGHIPNSVGIFGVLQSNMELVSHAEEFLYHSPVNYLMGEITEPLKPEEIYISQLADSVSKYQKYVSPTLVAFKSILYSARNIKGYINSVPLPQNHPIAFHWNWSPSVSDIPKKFFTETSISRLQYAYAYQLKLVEAFNNKGVVILLGTDSPTIPGLVPGYSLHQEMQILSEAGLSNYDILKSATLNAAQFLNISNDFGTIEEGKEASFILLSKNPLADIQNTLSIEKVFYCGQTLK